MPDTGCEWPGLVSASQRVLYFTLNKGSTCSDPVRWAVQKAAACAECCSGRADALRPFGLRCCLHSLCLVGEVLLSAGGEGAPKLGQGKGQAGLPVLGIREMSQLLLPALVIAATAAVQDGCCCQGADSQSCHFCAPLNWHPGLIPPQLTLLNLGAHKTPISSPSCNLNPRSFPL